METSLINEARAHYSKRDWADAYSTLRRADAISPLQAEDLSRLIWSAGLLGHDAEMLAAQERLYQISLDEGNELEAARSAFWLGFRLFSLGEQGKASAWLTRAERIAAQASRACAVQGYLLLPRVHRAFGQGEYSQAAELAAEAITIGEQCKDPDLTALGRNLRGRALLRCGDVHNGLAMLDEAMLSVANGELSPLVTGLVYCNVIAGCQQIQAIERSREWTEALSQWCNSQPQLIKFTNACFAHRAEMRLFYGQWDEALSEAQRSAALDSDPRGARDAAANGLYQQAEVYRLRGKYSDALTSYEKVAAMGRDPLPGLALLRLAQGQKEMAASALRRLSATTKEPLQRIQFLFALIHVLVQASAQQEAHEASEELDRIATQFDSSVLKASAAQARGEVLLVAGKADEALMCLRQALDMWHMLGTPYHAASTGLLMAQCYCAMDDSDAAAMQLRNIKTVFESLGAKPDLDKVSTLLATVEKDSTTMDSHELTKRELQVLKLVATGATNKAIANELGLSDKTIERHLGSIFSKLGLTSRAAATAYAFQHGLAGTRA